MKNYFTGFITAICLTASLFLFMGSQNIKTQTEPIIITSEEGTTKIGGGFIEIDSPSGKKIFDVNVGNSNHGELTIYNKNGNSISEVSANEEGDGYIKVHNESGKKVIDINSSNHCWLCSYKHICSGIICSFKILIISFRISFVLQVNT